MEQKEYIRFVRKRLRLSQRAFGEAFGKSRDTIANYERGSAIPPTEFMKQIHGLDKKTKGYKPLSELIGG